MARVEKPSAGVIGLGIIGSRIAANLRRAGYQVWLWNRSPRPEPNFLSSPTEVAESAKIIQIFVSDGPALLEVVEGMSGSLGPDHIIINHATVSLRETLGAARIVQNRSARFLDAPFTGSREAAAAGQIVYYIGGDELTLAKVRPLLEVSAKGILPIGDIGQATVMKIATNLIVAVMVGSFAEALSLLDKSGIPLYKLVEAFQHHGAHSALADMKIPAMITGNFDPHFSLKHMFKDIRIALAMAEEYGVELPEAAAFAGSAMSGIQKGWAEADFSTLSRHYGFSSQTLPDGLLAAKASNGQEKDSAAEKLMRTLAPFFAKK